MPLSIPSPERENPTSTVGPEGPDASVLPSQDLAVKPPNSTTGHPTQQTGVEDSDSSLCNSPTWSNFGLKKRDRSSSRKAKDRKKQDKHAEGNESDTKAAQVSRRSNRLSKAPPVTTRGFPKPALGDRLLSAPAVVTTSSTSTSPTKSESTAGHETPVKSRFRDRFSSRGRHASLPVEDTSPNGEFIGGLRLRLANEEKASEFRPKTPESQVIGQALTTSHSEDVEKVSTPQVPKPPNRVTESFASRVARYSWQDSDVDLPASILKSRTPEDTVEVGSFETAVSNQSEGAKSGETEMLGDQSNKKGNSPTGLSPQQKTTEKPVDSSSPYTLSKSGPELRTHRDGLSEALPASGSSSATIDLTDHSANTASSSSTTTPVNSRPPSARRVITRDAPEGLKDSPNNYRDQSPKADRNSLPVKTPSALSLPDQPVARPSQDISFLPELKHQPLVRPAKARIHSENDIGRLSGRRIALSAADHNAHSSPDFPSPHPYRGTNSNGSPSASSSRVSFSGDISEKSVGTSKARKPSPASQRLMPLSSGKGSASQTALAQQQNGPPIAKMFVICCSCKFWHDLPSKVYEAMSRSDGPSGAQMVEDKVLGVSGRVTTVVECPWCGHGMRTRCCAGYAAVVRLCERFH